MSQATASVSELLQQYRAAYLSTLPGRLAQLDALADQLPDPALAVSVLPALERCAHSLAGSAGTFGLAQLGETARKLEHAVEEERAGAGHAGRVLSGVDALRGQLQAVIVEAGTRGVAQ